MSALTSILAELGIISPHLHADNGLEGYADWVVDQPFRPETGKHYEIAYGKVFVHGRFSHVIARVRTDGPHPSQWHDLDEHRTLDPELQACQVMAFRPIQPPA